MLRTCYVRTYDQDASTLSGLDYPRRVHILLPAYLADIVHGTNLSANNLHGSQWCAGRGTYQTPKRGTRFGGWIGTCGWSTTRRGSIPWSSIYCSRNIRVPNSSLRFVIVTLGWTPCSIKYLRVATRIHRTCSNFTVGLPRRFPQGRTRTVTTSSRSEAFGHSMDGFASGTSTITTSWPWFRATAC